MKTAKEALIYAARLNQHFSRFNYRVPKAFFSTFLHPVLNVFLCCSFVFFTMTFSLVSCSDISTVTSVYDKLAQVDVLIAARDYGDAWSSLKKIAKDAHRPYDQLGVVRRALLLDKTEYAKTMLEDALKTFPDNHELLAVYTHMLMSTERYDEALENAYKLEGGKYGSLYSELRFKTDGRSLEGKEEKPIDYYSTDYAQAYLDIAKATGDGKYLRNAALVQVLHGNMSSAFTYHPKTMSAYDSPLFWAQISYDSFNFAQCVEDLSFLENSTESVIFLADAYLHLGNEEQAKIAWRDSSILFPDAHPEALYNLARLSLNMEDIEQAKDLLFYLVERFPDYVPGLVAYGRFSVLEPVKSSDTIFSALLEDRGVQTLQMERDASIPQIPSSDALYRMEQSLERLQAENASNAMRLLLEYTKLRWDSSVPPITARQKTIDMWALLENNAQEPLVYDPFLVHYALWYFCSQGMIAEADGLLTAYCMSRYVNPTESIDSPDNASMDSMLFEKPPFADMEDWEYDFGGYIALRQKRYADAEEWLSFFVNEGEILYSTPISAMLNLSTLYNGSGRRLQALEIYKDVLLLTQDKRLQADIYYRIALIQQEMNETRSAILSLNQCLSLDSTHNQARLLFKQINTVR